MNYKNSFFVKYILLILVLIFTPNYLYSFRENNLFKKDIVLISSVKDTNDKDIQSSFEESEDSGLPSNPGDLMNILKRLEAMNDATEPSDAIDDALKAFETEDARTFSHTEDFLLK